MKIKRVKLVDFRNIGFLDLELSETANIIYGNNGQGKTNFIEAIWLFTGAKSFRGAKDSQLVRFEQPQAALTMDFFAQERDQTAMITIENRRSATLNEIPLKSAGELAGHFCAVVFSPTHLTLVKNGPQEKRKFIDTSICQMKPKYIHVLNQYMRTVDQRNHLLKDISLETSLFDTLDIWDARMASFAAVLVKTRKTFLDRLLPHAQQVYAGISKEQEPFDFTYACTFDCDLDADVQTIEHQILSQLRDRRSEDIKARVSTFGPHRDDIELFLDGKSARIYGSQGQQRSCVLALKLAECQLIKETIGEEPLVLLDDVMSELDENRRDYLLNHLGSQQLIITCCDKADFKNLKEGARIRMEDGKARRVRS